MHGDLTTDADYVGNAPMYAQAYTRHNAVLEKDTLFANSEAKTSTKVIVVLALAAAAFYAFSLRR